MKTNGCDRKAQTPLLSGVRSQINVILDIIGNACYYAIRNGSVLIVKAGGDVYDSSTSKYVFEN